MASNAHVHEDQLSATFEVHACLQKCQVLRGPKLSTVLVAGSRGLMGRLSAALTGCLGQSVVAVDAMSMLALPGACAVRFGVIIERCHRALWWLCDMVMVNARLCPTVLVADRGNPLAIGCQ